MTVYQCTGKKSNVKVSGTLTAANLDEAFSLLQAQGVEIEEVKEEGTPLIEEVKEEGTPLIEEAKEEGTPLIEEAKEEGTPLKQVVSQQRPDVTPQTTETEETVSYWAGGEKIVIPKPPPLEGLGGVLILVGIGLFYIPYDLILKSWVLLQVLIPVVFQEENPSLSNFLTMLIIVNVGLALVCSYMWTLFFRKKKQFPKWCKAVYSFYLIWFVVVSIVFKVTFLEGSIFESKTMGQLFGVLFSAAIWIPYMIYSERVKNTFVR